ncbi:MAG: universal stress protein [Halodesulfurarchaeum sp.]
MGRQIVVPLDHSAQSWNALEYAFSQHPDAEFLVLHVLQPLDGILEGEVYGAETHRERANEEAEKLLEEAADLGATMDVSVRTMLREGRPATEIVAAAEEEAVDHVIMGSHGRSGVTRVLLGSVAERVVRRSPVPVTVVR